MTSLSVGSLLDDNIWHDVVISRNRKDIMFSVDRVQIQGRIKGEFYRLNLNRGVSILNMPFIYLNVNLVLYCSFRAHIFFFFLLNFSKTV